MTIKANDTPTRDSFPSKQDVDRAIARAWAAGDVKRARIYQKVLELRSRRRERQRG